MKVYRAVAVFAAAMSLGSCGVLSCSEYASDYSCPYVIDWAEYEVWYWRDVQRDDVADNQMVGRAVGLRDCENVARAYAAAIGKQFNYRAYMCHLMEDGMLMEKHRLL